MEGASEMLAGPPGLNSSSTTSDFSDHQFVFTSRYKHIHPVWHSWELLILRYSSQLAVLVVCGESKHFFWFCFNAHRLPPSATTRCV